MDFATGAGHGAVGPATDADCATCHGPGTSADIRDAHKIDQFVDNRGGHQRWA